MILRLPIHVTLFDSEGQEVQRFNSSKKSQIRLKLQGVSRGEWQSGTCRVFYNKPNDFWNEFKFSSVAQFEAGLLTVTERPLIDFLKDEIPEQYLNKRQLSPAQLKALKKAQSKSTMGVL